VVDITAVSRLNFGSAIQHLFGIALLLLMLAASTEAQEKSVTDGYTPTGAAPGAPAGSYVLSGLDNINFFNGHLNFRIPLLNIGGRGVARYTMTLPLKSAGGFLAMLLMSAELPILYFI
jgi:hypothetical protein